MPDPLRVLVVEDSEDDAALLVRELRRGGHNPIFERVDSAAAMEAALSAQPWDAVISDHVMPRFSAPAALAVLQRSGLDLPFLIVSGTIGEETAVAAMKAGAHDYILKDRLARLVPALERELREAASRRERRQADGRLREALHRQAYNDPVTGLPNRALLVASLDEKLANELPLALVVVDIDRFGHLNGTLGNQNGDLVLRGVGTRLARLAPDDSIVARVGADSFAMAIPGLAEVEAVGFAGEILGELRAPLALDGFAVNLEASVGIALCPEHGTDVDQLLNHCDAAVRQARRSVGSRAVYDSHRDPYRPERMALLAGLRRAIEDDELTLEYQPIVALPGADLLAAEALVRWLHPERGRILPDDFVPLAERTPLIKPLTGWVLQTAFAQLAAWRRSGLQMNMAVNVSATNLLDTEFMSDVAGAVDRAGISPDAVVLEITENAFIADLQQATQTVAGLKALGLQVALDDFGAGYSSFAHLQSIDITQVKIDRSFVQAVASPRGRAIVRSLIYLARNLDLGIVAEGVEDPRTLELLERWGATAAQGYHISRPLTAGAFVAWAGTTRNLGRQGAA